MAGKGQPCTVGELNAHVTLAKRKEYPDDYTSITEVIEPIAEVWAKVTPVGAQTYQNGVQTDTPFTHRIIIRWRPNADVEMFNVIQRKRDIPNYGPRNELYRIHRVEPWEGDIRYLILECEEERENTKITAQPFP